MSRVYIKFIRLFLVLMVGVFFLLGCGGGGDDKDTTPPIITLNGKASQSIIKGNSYKELGAMATDDRDGNITVKISGSIDVNKIGTYTITYTAKDKAGNKAKENRSVKVIYPTIKVTDAKLLTCLRKELNFANNKTPSNGQLFNLSRLDCNNQNLANSNIIELSKLINLKILNLNDNSITDVTPLSKLTKLEELYLASNGLSDISPLKKLKKLKVIGFYKNNISDISALKELVNLESLVISYNKLTDITALSLLAKLKELDIHGNYELSDITPLSTLTNLSSIEIWDTQIINLTPLYSSEGLKTITISNSCFYDNWILPDSVSINEIYEDENKAGCKSKISGYVVDDPIQNATIELQEINGTLIKRFESVTNADGSYSIKVDKKYKDKDFILRAYNGTMSSKAFDGDLYGYHLSGDVLEINLTPLNTVLLTLSSEFNDIEFSARLAKAKDLLGATYGVSEDEFSSIKDSDFSNFDIVKFRELVGSVGFNGLVQSLVADSIDGYADESDSKLLFASAKQRVLKDAGADFSVVDTDLDSDEVSKLTVKGVSEKEDGTTGTMDMLTDVIATKTETFTDADGNDVTKDTIVFRSFNVGKWKGKLNEETTLLARIFMDYRLSNLTPSVQDSIAIKLLKERTDDFKEALKYQDMATGIPFLTPYSKELMNGLRVFSLSYISNFPIAQTNKVNTTFSKFVQYQKTYNVVDDNIISMGLLEVKSTKDALEFANYAKVNYGFRAFEIDGVKQAYDYPFLDFKANIIKSTVKGGAVGGGWDYFMNHAYGEFNAHGNSIKYEKKLLGDSNSFDNISKVKLEMYKWQGGYPTLFNIADGLEIVGKSIGAFKGNISDKVKKKFNSYKESYEEFKDYALLVDSAIESLNMIVDGGEWIGKQYQIHKKTTNQKIFSDEFIALRKEANQLRIQVKTVLSEVDKVISVEGYSVPKEADAEKMKKYLGVSEKFDVIPPYEYKNIDNKFSTTTFKKLLINENKTSFKVRLKTRLLGKFNSIVIQGAINKIIKEKKAKDSSYKSDIDKFNEDFGKYFSFEQMHFVTAYIIVTPNKNKAIKKLKDDLKIKIELFTKAQGEYAQIMIHYLGVSAEKVGKVDMAGFVKANLSSSKGNKEALKVLKDLFSGASKIGSKDTKKLFIAGSKLVINSLEGESKKIVSNFLENAIVSIFGGGAAKALVAANDITSYVAGNFLTPNKQYLELNKNEDDVSIKRPPLTLVGIDSTGIIKNTGWDNIFNKDGKNNSYLIAVDNEDNVLYKPSFDVYLSQVRESNFKNMLKNAKFPDNKFMIFDLTIEKSDNNRVDGNFKIEKKSAILESLNIDDIQDAWLKKGKNDLYSFNIIDAWIHKLGGVSGGNYNKALIGGYTRGVYRDSILAEFIQPEVTEKEFVIPDGLTMEIVGKKNYIYKASTGKALGKQLLVEKIERAGNDYLRVENTNSFDVYFEVAYDKKVGTIYDDREQLGDYKVSKNSVYLLPLFNFEDNEGNYNDVEFIFYDEIAQDFFTNIGFSEPRLNHYVEAYSILGNLEKEVNKLAYIVKLDDITTTDNYLMITSYGNDTQTESTLSDKGEVKVEFNMPLNSDSFNKIKVYDVEEKRYLNSDEYTVTHTSGNEYLINIKNYRNHHEYKLVFPSDLTSESGAKFLEEREISNFVYYNKTPIAEAGADQTIKQGETVTLDASGSSDAEDDIDSLSFVWKEGDKELGTDKIITLNDLSFGTHTITLTVTDSEGSIGTTDKITIEVGNPLTKPTNLTQTKISNTKIKVSWDSVANAEGYIVYTSEDGWYDKLIGETGEGNKEHKITNSSTTSIEFDTEIGKKYWVSVRAYKGNLYSPYSKVFEVDISKSNIILESHVVKKTAQTITYAKYDDGFYEKGLGFNYTKEQEDILDRLTGLVWQDNSKTNGEKKTWSEAKGYCESLIGGWRLPRRNELSGLVQYDRYNPSINEVFEHTTSDYYWTESVNRQNEKNVWVVSFSEGVESTGAKTSSYSVRCVKERDSLVANAGVDQIVKEDVNVAFIGSNTPSKKEITSYSWSENGKKLGDTATFKLKNLRGGVHHIRLTVKDKDGNSDSDELLVTITLNNKILKKSGQNISYTKFDDGFYEKGVTINYTQEGVNILDRATGLLWQDSEDTNGTKRSWNDAKTYCEQFNGGNWRLPTRKELSGLVHYSYYNPSIDKLFKHTKADYYWSLDTSKRDATTAWVVSFSEGVESTGAKSTPYYTRCVQNNFVLTANAGADQFLEEGQPVTLRATQSPREELIVGYEWFDGDTKLGEGAELTLEVDEMRDGEHTITLVITDQDGNENRNSMTVTIVSNKKVLKKTSQNISYARYDDGYYEKGISLNYSQKNKDILDRTTGLMWQDSDDTNSTKQSWQEAKSYCASLEGHWRLATRKELSNLVDYGQYNPSIHKIFTHTASDYYWTVNTSIRNHDNAWVVSFSEGVESVGAKSASYYTRCVQSNFVPTANAGADLFIEKDQIVTLSASNSPRKSLIDSYLWESREDEIGYGETRTMPNLLSGRQNIYLTITDKEGKTDTDDLWVTIVANGKIVKKTGQTASYADHDDGDYQRGRSLSYSDHGNTVTDNTTGLEWKDDETTNSVKMTWEKANGYCSQGNNTWRLPTRRELSSLVDYGTYNPSIESSFDNTASDYYWTIEKSKRNNDHAWVISFSEGVESVGAKSSSYFVRCVNAN